MVLTRQTSRKGNTIQLDTPLSPTGTKLSIHSLCWSHTTVTYWNQAEYSLTVLVSDVSPAFLGLHQQLTTCQELTVITMTTDGIDVQEWAVMKAFRMTPTIY